MKVGVSQRLDVPAGLAAAAGGIRLPAEKQLGEPEGEALLPNTLRSVEENAGGKGTPSGGFREAAPNGFVAVERDQGHAGI